MAHTELGLKLLHRLAADMAELAAVEAEPKVDGRNMVMVLAPSRSRARVVPITGDAASDVDLLVTGVEGDEGVAEVVEEQVEEQVEA